MFRCSGSKTEYQADQVTDARPGQGEATREQESVPRFYINDRDNQFLASVTLGREPAVAYGESSLVKSCDRADKCKYKSADKRITYEVRYKDDGFKLRDVGGRLLWKVKIRADKIKIADNEEMEPVWEVKEKGGMAVLLFDGRESGSVDFGSAGLPVVVTGQDDLYFIAGESKELASGILAIGKMPMEQRLLIFAETAAFLR